jgi:lysozyme family protein
VADSRSVIEYVLTFEDATLSGTITTAVDGKRTRFGIDEHFHPELTNCLFYSSTGAMGALQLAIGIYERDYCQPLCIEEITSQAVANKLLSLGVNCGVGTAARMLQGILHVDGDGRIGPITLDHLDRADPQTVLDRLKETATAYYERLIERNPLFEQYRAGWMRRAAA